MIRQLVEYLLAHGVKLGWIVIFLNIFQWWLLWSYRKDFKNWENLPTYKQTWIVGVCFATLVFAFMAIGYFFSIGGE